MKNEMPKRLPTLKHKGEKYFIDWRLQEFRPIDRPFESIPFDSALGRKIVEMPETQKNVDPTENNVTVTCSSCAKLLFTGSENEARHLIIYCEDCGQ